VPAPQPRESSGSQGGAARGGAAAAGRVTRVFPGPMSQAKGPTSQGWGRGLGLAVHMWVTAYFFAYKKRGKL
jgi:hypothetical protein